MTREEAIKVLSESIHDGSKVPWDKIVEAVHLSIEALSQPSLPSNFDEASIDFADNARKQLYSKDYAIASIADYDHGCIDGFKAGAEWLAGQFQKIEGDLVEWYSTSDGKDYCCGVKKDEAFEIPEGFYIRKKQ